MSGPVRTLTDMSERFEMRVSSELLERLDAARGFESRASFVKRGLVMLLEVMAEPAASGRPPVEMGDVAEAPMDFKPVKATSPRRAASKPFRCPIYDCTFMASSDAAVCGKHGRKVIPA